MCGSLCFLLAVNLYLHSHSGGFYPGTEDAFNTVQMLYVHVILIREYRVTYGPLTYFSETLPESCKQNIFAHTKRNGSCLHVIVK